MATPNAGLLVEITLVCRRDGGRKFILKMGPSLGLSIYWMWREER